MIEFQGIWARHDFPPFQVIESKEECSYAEFDAEWNAGGLKEIGVCLEELH
jgi:hypothetical protein